ncbi:unnamed protein product, partial [Brassica oleracea var. botrytis]
VDNLLNKAIATDQVWYIQQDLQHDLREMCDSVPRESYPRRNYSWTSMFDLDIFIALGFHKLCTFWDNYAFAVEYFFSLAYVFDVVKLHVDQSQTLL